MAATTTVRPKRSGDEAAVLAVARALPPWFNAEGLATIAREVRVDPGFVAEAGPHVVGFALWRGSGAGDGELTWLGVDPAFHRSGTGTALLESVGAAARAAGLQRLLVSTVADNVDYPPYADTRRFYRARGFVDLRVDRDFYGDAKGRYDRLMLVRAL